MKRDFTYVDDVVEDEGNVEAVGVGPACYARAQTCNARVGVKLDGGALRNEPCREFLDGLPRGLGIRPAEAGLQKQPLRELSRIVGTAAAEFGVVEAVDIVGDANEELQVEGPVMAGLERAEAVEHDRFLGRGWTQGLVEQQAVAAEALDVSL